MDGTLLNDKKEIPFLTKCYLQKISDKYHIILASGRPTNNIKFFSQKLKLKTPIIAFNGLNIHYLNNEQSDKCIYFNKKIIKNIINDIEQKFKIKNIIFANKKNVFVTNDNKIKKNNHFLLLNMKLVCGDLQQNLNHKIMNFVIEFENKKINRNQLLEILQKYPYHNASFWPGKYLGFVEIYHNGSNKYKAVMDVAKKMAISEKNIIVFGNDFNDLEMLEKIPSAYAMKNSIPEIKKHAHLITKFDNNNNGVMKELQVILKDLK